MHFYVRLWILWLLMLTWLAVLYRLPIMMRSLSLLCYHSYLGTVVTTNFLVSMVPWSSNLHICLQLMLKLLLRLSRCICCYKQTNTSKSFILFINRNFAKAEVNRHHHHHQHHVHEVSGVFPVPYSSKWSWCLHLIFGRPTFLLPSDLYFSACLDILFVSILCTCCSHFFWYCFRLKFA
jgi:hypothetical protein